MSTPIFSPEQTIKYAETRLFGRNVRPGAVRNITLYNAVMPSELERMLQQNHDTVQQVSQDNGREPIFYTTQELHIPQYSGFGRRKRYEEMVRAYVKAKPGQLTFESLERNGEADRTDISYDNHAYDFVKEMFSVGRPRLSTIIFGPLPAVAKQSNVTALYPNEYLNSQVVEVGDQLVLNVGYVYADQAGIILDKMTRKFEAHAREQGIKMPVSLYLFGRVGSLHDTVPRDSIVVPTAILDENDLLEKRHSLYPMHNALAQRNSTVGINLNVNSVMGETREILELAKKQGCISVDMEIREAVESVNKARRRYQHLDLRFGFAGYVSDLPLQGDTLAEELTSDQGEQEAVKLIVEHIKKSA